MRKDWTGTIVLSASSVDSLAGSPRDVLTEILRDGAQRLLAAEVEAEVVGYIDRHADQVDTKGHRLVVRNGHAPARTCTIEIWKGEC